jgi:hypothetical protein
MDDLEAHLLGLAGQALLLDQQLGLLLGTSQDRLRLLPRALQQVFDFGVDALGRPDLFGDSVPELIDALQRFGLVDDDASGKGEPPAVVDERLEPLDEVDDVDRTGPPGAGRAGCRTPGL